MFISFGRPGQAKARFGKPFPHGFTVSELTLNPQIPQSIIENIPTVQKLDLELRLGQPGHTMLALGHETRVNNNLIRERAPDHITDQNQGSKKYGPCVRCGMTFDVSTSYANHMYVHYTKEDTEEQNIARRLAKKYKRKLKSSRFNKI